MAFSGISVVDDFGSGLGNWTDFPWNDNSDGAASAIDTGRWTSDFGTGGYVSTYYNAATDGPNFGAYYTVQTAQAVSFNFYALNACVQQPSNSSDTGDGYKIEIRNDTGDLWHYRMDNAVATQIGATQSVTALASGDKWGVEVLSDGTIQAYVDTGSGWATLGASRSDSTYSSGYGGMHLYDDSGQSFFDDYAQGTIVTAVSKSGTDSASLAESSAVSASPPATDSATASSSGTPGAALSASDAATGVDTSETGASAAGTDSGTHTGSIGGVSVDGVADTGSMGDSGSSSPSAAASDSASESEAVDGVSLPVSDSASSADSSTPEVSAAGTDSISLADVVAEIAIARSDTASLASAVSGLLAATTATDAPGVLAASSAIAAAIQGTESVTFAGAVAIALDATESGSAADATSALAAAATTGDTASVAEVIAGIALAAADSGDLAEAAEIGGEASKAATDSFTFTGSAAVQALLDGAETVAALAEDVAIALAASEASSAGESSGIAVGRDATDQGTASDSSSAAPAVGGADSGASSEASNPEVSAAGTDAATAGETVGGISLAAAEAMTVAAAAVTVVAASAAIDQAVTTMTAQVGATLDGNDEATGADAVSALAAAIIAELALGLGEVTDLNVDEVLIQPAARALLIRVGMADPVLGVAVDASGRRVSVPIAALRVETAEAVIRQAVKDMALRVEIGGD